MSPIHAVSQCCDERENGITFLDSLDEVCRDEIIVDASPTGLLREARANLWAFSVTQQQAQQLTLGQVFNFFRTVAEARGEQLSGLYGVGHQMYFYLWCDEQASQLRFSLVSAHHGRLPFGCPITVIPEPSGIIERFLHLPYHDGIPLETMGAVDSVDDIEVEGSTELSLEVWTQLIPEA